MLLGLSSFGDIDHRNVGLLSNIRGAYGILSVQIKASKISFETFIASYRITAQKYKHEHTDDFQNEATPPPQNGLHGQIAKKWLL